MKIKFIFIVMRITTLCLLIGFMQLSARTLSQTVTLNVQEKPLEEVLSAIEEQTGYFVFTSEVVLKHSKSVTLNIRDKPLTDVLKLVFEKQPLSYQIDGQTIRIKRKSEADQLVQLDEKVEVVLPVVSLNLVKGTVTDQKGAPLPGVTIRVKGTSVVTQSDSNGKFTIDATEGQVLTITLLGYEPVEKPITSTNFVTIALKESVNELDEVVVTGLGVKKEKKSLGYAMTSITTEQLSDLGSPVNAMTSMYGQVPGLRISSTALGPTGGLNINIRNAVAFSESSNVRPLFVIDGIPMLDWQTDINRNPGNGLNDLNLDDIASFDILRGAKASLLYGSQGANGVILITTKTGRKRPGFGLDVNLSTQIDKPWVQQEFQNEFGSGYPTAWGVYSASDDGFYLKDGKEAYAPTTYNFGPRIDGRTYLYYDNTEQPYQAYPDNFKDLYRTGATTTANVSLSGGGEIGGFRIAYTHKDYKGIFEGFKTTEDNVTFNGNMNVTDRVKMQLVSTFSNNFNHNSPSGYANFVTYGIPRNLDVDLLRTQVIDPETGYSFWQMDNRATTMNPGSVVRTTYAEQYFFSQWKDTYNNSRNHFTNSLNLNVKLTDALSIDATGGFDWIINDANTVEVLRKPLSSGSGGSNSLSNSQRILWSAQAMLRYERSLSNPDFHFSGFVGGVYQSNSDRSLSRSTRDGYITGNWSSLDNSKNNVLNSSSDLGSDVLYGLFASAQLGYKDYLFADFQARNDWSSILPTKNNSYFYPGTSLSWVFSESMGNKPDWLNLGKLRASWADVGRPGSRYFSNDVYSVGSYDGNITYSASSTIPALNLKPERKREFEIGLESKLFNNRLGFEFSYFSANTYNQIMALSIPISSGYSNVGVNAGNITNKGYELVLTGSPVKTRDFSWDLIINGSASTPKIQKLANGITSQSLWGALGARVVANEHETYGQIQVYPYATNEDGNRLVDASGYYYQDKTKQKNVGNVIPDFVGGLISNFTYKNWVLGLDFDASFGSTMVSMTNMYMIGNGSSIKTLAGRDESLGGLPYYVNQGGQMIQLNSHTEAVPSDSKYSTIFHDGVVLPGVKEDGTPNDVVITAADKYSYYWQGFWDLQEDAVYKNDYIKLRNITLSYAIPKIITKKLKFEKLVLTGFVNNVGFLYKTMPNVDPESFQGTNQYYELNAYPSTRSYGFSIRATF